MKILVMSDSHGNTNAILSAINKELPDYIIHLGDGVNDTSVIKANFPDIPLHAVKGNCDFFSSLAETEVFVLNNKKFLITHGHLFYVKSSLFRLMKYADEQKCDIVLFGHTHKPHNEEVNGILYVNPGCMGFNYSKRYAVIELTEDKVTCELLNI